MFLKYMADCHFSIFYWLNGSHINSYHSNGTADISQTILHILLKLKTYIWTIKSLISGRLHWKNRNFRILAHCGSHLGRHLEYLKLLKGDRFTPTWISLDTPQGWIISREKKTLSDVRVRWKFGLWLLDYWFISWHSYNLSPCMVFNM